MDSSGQCIYCKRSGIPFSREHVIPEAFGTFGPKTMVLTEAVCADCNQRLGRGLDQILARDTFEGLLRAEKLTPRRIKKDRFKARRIVIRVPDEPRFTDFRGAQMTIDWQTRKPRLLNQVIVRDEEGRLHSFTRGEMADADDKLFRDRPPGSIQVIGTLPEEVKELQHMAASKGVRFKSWKPTDVEPPPASREPTTPLEVEGFIDEAVWRAIAKIAFNYLAKIEGSAYVLDSKFNRIRAFIVGEFEDRALVRYSKRPILANETSRYKTNEMHLVLFERQGYGLRGRVSLFNSFTYDVMLCANLGLIYSIKSGHAFDPIRKDVSKLVGISRSLKIGRN